MVLCIVVSCGRKSGEHNAKFSKIPQIVTNQCTDGEELTREKEIDGFRLLVVTWKPRIIDSIIQMKTFSVLFSLILRRLSSEEIWPLLGFFTVSMIPYNLYSRDTLETKAPWMEVELGFALCLSVKVLFRVLIGDTIFTSLTGDRTAILCGHRSEPRESSFLS